MLSPELLVYGHTASEFFIINQNDVQASEKRYFKQTIRIQSLAILLDAPSIFSICIVLWVHMRHCSVTCCTSM